MVGNKRKAEMNVVKVKPQSRKNCGVKRGKSGVEEELVAMEYLKAKLPFKTVHCSFLQNRT